jgi:hypothetical protein
MAAVNAAALAGAARPRTAFEWLEKALEARDSQMALLNVEPLLDALPSDPRFAALGRASTIIVARRISPALLIPAVTALRLPRPR